MIDEYIRKWIIKADNDLKIAGHELTQPENEMVTDAICFHCQQSVEKLLKAYLASKNIDFGKTHNLEFLLELCKKQDSLFENINVGNLSFYAVEVRYPDEFYIPSVEEARECFKIASTVRHSIIKQLESKAK
ncbi:HEPN domain protein [uncultured archaeon]|nr:HEPN domain protein [uncultured archaeon]